MTVPYTELRVWVDEQTQEIVVDLLGNPRKDGVVREIYSWQEHKPRYRYPLSGGGVLAFSDGTVLQYIYREDRGAWIGYRELSGDAHSEWDTQNSMTTFILTGRIFWFTHAPDFSMIGRLVER